MLIIPAIDLKDGQCVRLKQGVMEDVTVFSENPGAMARHWLDQGARRLHLVDLNGAFAGRPKNELAIRDIVEAIGDEIPTQLGGGIRDLETIERYLDDGITYIIIGTAAVKDARVSCMTLVRFSRSYMGGWMPRRARWPLTAGPRSPARRGGSWRKNRGLWWFEALLYTDIGRDGMLSGVNIEATVELARHYYSGHCQGASPIWTKSKRSARSN